MLVTKSSIQEESLNAVWKFDKKNLEYVATRFEITENVQRTLFELIVRSCTQVSLEFEASKSQ